MNQAILLESFDEIQDPLAPENPSFQAGFDAGLAAAAEQNANDTGLLRADLVQAIGDLDYTFAEAHAAVLGSLSTVMEDLAKTLLPGIAADCFRLQVVSVLQEMAAQHAPQVFSIRIHPSQLAALQTATQNHEVNAHFTADPDVSENQAWITHPDRTVHVDMHTALAEVLEIISAGSKPQDATKTQS